MQSRAGTLAAAQGAQEDGQASRLCGERGAGPCPRLSAVSISVCRANALPIRCGAEDVDSALLIAVLACPPWLSQSAIVIDRLPGL